MRLCGNLKPQTEPRELLVHLNLQRSRDNDDRNLTLQNGPSEQCDQRLSMTYANRKKTPSNGGNLRESQPLKGPELHTPASLLKSSLHPFCITFHPDRESCDPFRLRHAATFSPVKARKKPCTPFKDSKTRSGLLRFVPSVQALYRLNKFRGSNSTCVGVSQASKAAVSC